MHLLLAIVATLRLTLICWPGSTCGITLPERPSTVMVGDATIAHISLDSQTLCIRARDSGSTMIVVGGATQTIEIDLAVDRTYGQGLYDSGGGPIPMAACTQPLALLSIP